LTLFDSFIPRVRFDSGRPVHYERNGTLDVALDAESLSRLRQHHQLLTSEGIEAHLLDAAALRRAEPHISSDAIGGLLIPMHGFVAASELTSALAAAATRHGARFLECGRVASIAKDGSALRLQTAEANSETLLTDIAVLAAGSWAGGVHVEGLRHPLPVRPIRGQLLHVRWLGTPPGHTLWSERCYMVPWKDGTVLVGATEEDAGFEEHTTLAGIQDLIDAACDLLPHAWTASLLAAKVGLRPASSDHIPLIGWSTTVPNLMYATGHYRNGILLAPLTAELVANAILERRSDPLLELTRPQRFGDSL
jgi:glycine oxidase